MNLYPVNLYCCKFSQLLIKETLQCATQITSFKPLQERRNGLYVSTTIQGFFQADCGTLLQLFQAPVLLPSAKTIFGGHRNVFGDGIGLVHCRVTS